jgi:hypothetical protein
MLDAGFSNMRPFIQYPESSIEYLALARLLLPRLSRYFASR